MTKKAFSGSCLRCSSLLRKCVVSLVNELCSMYYAGDGLQIVNTFSRWAITGNNKAFVFGVRRYQETFSVVVNVDCKTVCFFLKISKEIVKAWRKSLTRAKRASLTRP